MRTKVQEKGPARAEDFELIKALHLAGSGRVRASVDERMLSLETRSGHGLDLRLSNISRVHHHHTRLVPFSFALIGAGLIYMAQRILIPNTLQMVAAAFGVVFILGWLGTRKPTLTLDTEAGDCHTITGNDASLMRLATLLKRLESGMSLEDARIGLDILDRDTEFPRTAIRELQEVPVQPVHIQAPTSIRTFLSDALPEDEISASVVSLDLFNEEIDLDFGDHSPASSGWMTGQDIAEPVARNEHGLLSRGIANAHDRRGALPQVAQTPEHRFADHPSAQFPTTTTQRPVSSFQQIAQSTTAELPREHRDVHTTDVPQSFIPSFQGPNGVHMPAHSAQNQRIEYFETTDVFRSPDSLQPEAEPTTSLIESARTVNATETPTPAVPEIVPRTRGSRLRPKSAQRPGTRLRPKTRSRTTSVNRFSNMVRPAAAQMIGNATEMANRLFNSRNEQQATEESSSTRELRQRSAETLQSESIESILNLSIKRGGYLPDKDIEVMLAHMNRRQTFMEQDEQAMQEVAQLPHLDDVSFGELKDSKTHHAENAGKGGLPRLDL
ncbi:MAG: hypothetical protein P8R00_03630 [Candidatus Poseidoniaceae archaeon]|nr:hypothetical protein [Candidatus Poseidoniaceae archaeon]